MWQGKTFRVKREILAVRGREDLQYIPVGALVEVVSNHDSDAPKFIDVRWNGTDYSVFAIDLAGRGEETAASRAIPTQRRLAAILTTKRTCKIVLGVHPF